MRGTTHGPAVETAHDASLWAALASSHRAAIWSSQQTPHGSALTTTLAPADAAADVQAHGATFEAANNAAVPTTYG